MPTLIFLLFLLPRIAPIFVFSKAIKNQGTISEFYSHPPHMMTAVFTDFEPLQFRLTSCSVFNLSVNQGNILS